MAPEFVNTTSLYSEGGRGGGGRYFILPLYQLLVGIVAYFPLSCCDGNLNVFMTFQSIMMTVKCKIIIKTARDWNSNIMAWSVTLLTKIMQFDQFT